jgi:hypothetical protein
MKSLRNKVILSGIVLLFAFIATIGSTYAWFTVSTESSVTGINLQVTAADNLLIRPKSITNAASENFVYLRDVGNYSTSVSATELETEGYFYEDPATKLIPWRLKPSTTISNEGLTDINDPKGGLYYINNIDAVRDGDGTTPLPAYTIATSNLNSGYYITLEFWMLSQGDDPKGIVLNSFSITSGAGNSTGQSQVINATRLAFWGDDTEYADDAGFIGSVGSTYIFGTDGDYDYSIATTSAAVLAPTPSPAAPTINATAAAVPLLYTLQPNTPTMISVIIFIEGWDAEASNEIILSNFDIAFSFAYAA